MRKCVFVLIIVSYILLSDSFSLKGNGVSEFDVPDSLLRVASEMVDSIPQKARNIIDQALSLSRTVENQHNIAVALNYKGLTYYNEQDYEEAIACFQQSLKVLFRIGEKEKIANMMKKIGLTYFNQNKYNKAIEYYRFAQKIFEQLNSLNKKAKVHLEIGLIYSLSNQYVNAVHEFEKGLELFEILDNKVGQIDAMHKMAISYHKYGNTKKAEENFTKALKIQEKYIGNFGFSELLNAYANLLIDTRNYHQALTILEIAKNRINRKDSILYSDILANYGTVLIHEDELEEALKYLNQSLKIANPARAKDVQAKAYRSLYDLSLRNNDTWQALVFYQKFVAVKDTAVRILIPQKISRFEDTHEQNNLIIVITAFSFVIIISLIVWLVIVIRQRDRALDKLKNLKRY